uniref:LysR substrate-binding domain-containing protein n=1 Tax=Bordetella ansorpii TaxID=288768 RepID=UPI0012E983A6|nr:LysR substrate-binding domain-containing protein [Bordetella ansorpii]
MHDATSPRPQLRLAIAPGVASSYLAALLALQRAEEPEVSMEFNEVTASDLITGLYKRRFDVVCTRPIADGPYEVITHLQRLSGQTNLVADRFELRALRVAEARKA